MKTYTLLLDYDTTAYITIKAPNRRTIAKAIHNGLLTGLKIGHEYFRSDTLGYTLTATNNQDVEPMYTIEHEHDFEKRTKAKQEKEWWELRKANKGSRGSRLLEHRVANPWSGMLVL